MANSSSITCNCKNTCARSTKRGACPCRVAGKKCTDLCCCGFSLPCINRETSRPPVPVSSCSTDLYVNSPSRQRSDDLEDTDSQPTLKRKKEQKRKKETKGTAAKKTKQIQREAEELLVSPTSTAPSSFRRRLQVNISAIEASPASPTPAGRERKTSTPRNSQATSRPSPATLHQQTVQNFAAQLDETSLRNIVVELLTRDPGAFQDYAQGYTPGPDPPQPPSPPQGSPAWCRCGNCRPMPAEAENKCCMGRGAVCCATEAPNFYLIVDPAVLDLAVAHFNDFMVHDQVRDNASYRHQAYRQYILQRFGRLGAGNRRPVPSCVVLAVRRRFPNPQGQYTGFLED